MPFKSEKIKLPNKYASGLYSQRSLASEYQVSRRLISFILDPEKYSKCREQFKERRKDGRYKPDKESWNKTMKEHRAYKQELFVSGKIE